MARIFRNLYHDLSSSWDFRNSAKNVENSNIFYEILRDQNGLYLLSFSSKELSQKIVFVYCLEDDEIISHDADLSSNYVKDSYYQYIEFAFRNISSSLLENNQVTIFDKKICKNNEYIQSQYQNITYQIEGFYEVEQTPLKIHFKNFGLEEFSFLITNLPFLSDKKNPKDWEEIIKIQNGFFAFFSSEEIAFFISLLKEKKSVALKSQYITITKEGFGKLIPFIKNIQEKFSILETGERLLFSESYFPLNLHVNMIDPENYCMKVSEKHKIHQYFVNTSTYILISNTMHQIRLPFEEDTVIKIFEKEMYFKQTDLIYFKTVVGKQLSLFSNYLDFDVEIIFPEISADLPKVYFQIDNSKTGLNITGYLEYADKAKIPINITTIKHNLFKYNTDKWYFIPDEMNENISKFIKEELFLDTNNIKKSSDDILVWKITNNVEVDYIKSNLYDKAHQSWHLVISEDIKPQFVQTINLVPEISIQTEENIDWFTYKVIYKFHNLEFTQEELRKFFASGDKYLVTKDGSNIRIGNRTVYDEIENMLTNNKKDADHYQKLAIYRLPWIYELKKINPAVTIYGDEYLDKMYEDLKKRCLPIQMKPHYSIDLILRSYQKTGYEWLKLLEKYRLNGILADDMGLGKTLQAISVLTDLSLESKSLIICPKTLLFNWAAEIEKFSPQLKYMIYEGSKDFRINLLKTVPVQIVLCSYSLIQNDLEEFSQIDFDYLILDEAQHIKNHLTLRSKAIKKVNSRHKLAMTGTPIENNITELWSIFDFLMPGYLPPLKKVVSELSNENGLEKLKQYIAPFILRRKKQDVLIELPDKQEQVVLCQMTEQQEKYYITVLNSVTADLNTTADKRGFSDSPFKILAALTRLRQICNHPALINNDWIDQADISGKMETLKEILIDALESGRKILIFSQFVKMLKIIEKMVKKLNVPYEYMDGSTKDRKSCINHFNNNDKVRLFLISLKTGGFGINLTSADTVILIDPWWNPMVSDQAIDRVHRIGQTKKVLVYKMITLGSVEEKIMHLQKKKRDLFENVIEEGENVIKGLGIEDIKGLFEYKGGT